MLESLHIHDETALKVEPKSKYEIHLCFKYFLYMFILHNIFAWSNFCGKLV